MKPDRAGQIGERLARWRLRLMGYRIIETNCRLPGGELDIVAKDRGVLVFVEVKTAATGEFGRPEEWVDTRKQKKLGKLATAYLARQGSMDVPCRFDVVAVSLEERIPKIRVIKNAFELEGE
jgi:putative endonuclease